MTNFFDQFSDLGPTGQPSPAAPPAPVSPRVTSEGNRGNFFDQFSHLGPNGDPLPTAPAETGPGGYEPGSLQDIGAFVGKGALDFAKNTATGLARGAAGLADYGYGLVAPEFGGGDPYEKLQQALPHYDPTTPAGRVYQGAVTGAVAGAPLGPEGIVAGTLGGGASSGAAEVTDNPFVQTGAGLIAGAAGARPTMAAGEAAYNRVAPSGTANRATAMLGAALKPEIKYGGTSGPQILDQISAFPDKPSMLADQAGSMQGMTEQLTSKMGPAKFIIEPALKARDADAGPRIINDIASTISNGGSAYATEKALTSAQQTTAAPLFKKAMANGPIHSDRLQQFLDDPLLQQGLQEGVKIQRLNALAEGKPFDPNAYTVTYDDAGDLRFQPTPNMQTLQTAKIGLDNIIDKYRDPYGNLNLDQTGRAVLKVSKAFNNELRTLNPDYAAANDAYAGPAASKDALRLGQQFRTMKPEQIADELSGMTPSEKQFFLQGAADSLITSVNKTGGAGNEARVMLGNSQVKQQLQSLFPSSDAYDAAIGRLAEENRQFQTNTQATGNSRTAFRMSGNKVQGDGVIPNAVGAAAALATGERMVALSAGTKALGALGRKLGFGSTSPAVEAEAARMLTETDPVRRQAIAQSVIDQATRRRSYSDLLGSALAAPMMNPGARPLPANADLVRRLMAPTPAPTSP